VKNTLALIARVREKTETRTNYAVAKALRMSPANLDRVLKGKSGLGNEACFRAAKLLHLPVAEVIAYVEEDRAKSAELREFWRLQLPRLLPSIAIAATALYVADPALIGGLEDGLRAFAAERQLDHAMYYANLTPVWFC
jgi:hypothetical protein